MTAKSLQELFLTAARIAATAEFPIGHPLNPNSEVHLRHLAETVGLQRRIITMARIPPSKELYIYHAHADDEEWIKKTQAAVIDCFPKASPVADCRDTRWGSGCAIL